MLFGTSPFKSRKQEHIMRKIIAAQAHYPEQPAVSAECTDLIRKLLDPSVATRIGCAGGGAAEIRAHPWYAGVDWRPEVMWNAPPVLQPRLKGPCDCAYFRKFKSEDDQIDPLAQGEEIGELLTKWKEQKRLPSAADPFAA
eukprot:gene11879-45037_t